MILEIKLLIMGFAQINSNALPRNTIEASFPSVMRIVFVVAALLSIIFIALGGLKYTLSGGDSQGIQKAKNTILYAVIGLAVTLSAYTIISFVTGRLV